jgi:hypothetical protein
MCRHYDNPDHLRAILMKWGGRSTLLVAPLGSYAEWLIMSYLSYALHD